MGKSETAYELQRRRVLRKLGPGQTTFIPFGGAVWPVYRPKPPSSARYAR